MGVLRDVLASVPALALTAATAWFGTPFTVRLEHWGAVPLEGVLAGIGAPRVVEHAVAVQPEGGWRAAGRDRLIA